jgi:Poxvirus A32 protein
MDCQICGKTFSRKSSWVRHNIEAHDSIDGISFKSLNRNRQNKTNLSNTWKMVRTGENPISQNGGQITCPTLFEQNSPYLGSFDHERFDHSECVDYDYTLKAPFSMVISGMPQSGKSTLTAKLLERRNEVITTSDGRPINRILYCYTEHQPRFFRELAHRVPEIKFHKGLPSEYADGSDSPSIVVLDDLMNEASKSDDAVAAFTRTSHHRNVCLIMLVQNFFHKNLRNLTSCCHYMCIMKNPRDSSFLSCLGRQMNGGKNNVVLDDAYKDCMKKPYGYVFIDATQQQNDKYRIRDNIFPEDCTVFTKC